MATKATIALLSISAITKMDITGITTAFVERVEATRKLFVELGKLAYGLSKKIDRDTTWQKHLKGKGVSDSNIANATHAFKVIDRYVSTGTISEDRFDALTLRDMQALAKDSGGLTTEQVQDVFRGKSWRGELDFLIDNGKTKAEAKKEADDLAAQAAKTAPASTPATTPAANPATAKGSASSAPATTPASTASTTEAGKGTTPAPATGEKSTVPAPVNIIRLDSQDQSGLVVRAGLVIDELAEIVEMIKSPADKAKIEARVKALFATATPAKKGATTNVGAVLDKANKTSVQAAIKASTPAAQKAA
jgi:hypothetical protein